MKRFVKRFRLWIVMVAVTGLFYGVYFFSAGATMARQRNFLLSCDSFTLYSLDPSTRLTTDDETPEQLHARRGRHFHKCRILGQTNVKDVATRARLVDALHQGMKGNWSFGIMCFSPHHGIRAQNKNGKYLDLVICFECQKIENHTNTLAKIAGVNTTQEPLEIFNQALKAAGVPAPPALFGK